MRNKLGEQGKHIALVGATSYSWIAGYYGIVNGGSVAVPLDANLPAEDLCELIDRADATTFLYDASKENVALMAAEKCPSPFLVAFGEGQILLAQFTYSHGLCSKCKGLD